MTYSLNDRVGRMEAKMLSKDNLSDDQLSQYMKAVAVLGKLHGEVHPKEKPKAFALIHAAVRNKYNVSSYYLLKDKDFPEILEFLASWWRKLAPGKSVPEIFQVQQPKML